MAMKKSFYIAALILATVLPVAAQDTYESARLLGSDLNGTARYVGMGGAMEALGADISTISTNPAGIGLFRHSTVGASASLGVQQGVQRFEDQGTTKMSFDQVGLVFSSRVSRRSFVNVAFNYHKSRNFNQIVSAANRLRNASQNMLSYHKADLGNVRYGGYSWDFNENDAVVGYINNTSSTLAQTFSQSDYVNLNNINLDEDEEGFLLNYNPADNYMFDRAQRGWINEYDFCVSGNQSDRFYWGVTVGIHDVNYKTFSTYTERLLDINDNPAGSDGNEDYIDYLDNRIIEGTGIDIKAGIIFRSVIENSGLILTIIRQQIFLLRFHCGHSPCRRSPSDRRSVQTPQAGRHEKKFPLTIPRSPGKQIRLFFRRIRPDLIFLRLFRDP